MRKICPAEFSLAAALFAVSGVTALADNYIRPSVAPDTPRWLRRRKLPNRRAPFSTPLDKR